MTMAFNVTLSGSKQRGDGSVSELAPAPYSNSNVVEEDDYRLLVSGDNAIPVPVEAGFVCIEMPAGNAVAVTYRTVNGDTGIPIALTGWAAFQFTPGSFPTLYLHAASNMSGYTSIWFD